MGTADIPQRDDGASSIGQRTGAEADRDVARLIDELSQAHAALNRVRGDLDRITANPAWPLTRRIHRAVDVAARRRDAVKRRLGRDLAAVYGWFARYPALRRTLIAAMDRIPFVQRRLRGLMHSHLHRARTTSIDDDPWSLDPDPAVVHAWRTLLDAQR